MESEVLQQVAALTRTVVATGGGAVTSRKNWGYMRHAIVIYLEGSSELLARRIDADGAAARPLMVGEGDTLAKVEAKMAEREALYREADVFVSIADDSGRESAPTATVVARIFEGVTAKIQEYADEKAAKTESAEESLAQGQLPNRMEGPTLGGAANPSLPSNKGFGKR